MTGRPEGWRVIHGRDPEVESRRLKGRFRKISRRYLRTKKRRHLYRRAKMLILPMIGVFIPYLGLTTLSPWPPMITLRHIASSPNCSAARAVGLAPARRGAPGYWRRHDRDRDGTACEPWPYR